jgi:hypothetical protein
LSSEWRGSQRNNNTLIRHNNHTLLSQYNNNSLRHHNNNNQWRLSMEDSHYRHRHPQKYVLPVMKLLTEDY